MLFMRDLCITPLFARFRRQAQISILEILQCIPVVKIFAFLELEQNWTFFKGLYDFGAANIFKPAHIYLFRFVKSNVLGF